MKSHRFLLPALALAGAFALGCDEPKKVAVTTTPANSTKLVSTLQEADKLDGKEDHVIGKCYACSLGMDGKATIKAKFQDYEAHFCSQGCCDEFQKDPEAMINSTAIPTKAAH